MPDAPARWVTVEAERLDGWLSRFRARHGDLVVAADEQMVTVTAEDGAVARCQVPFPPLVCRANLPSAGLVAHAVADRRVGVLLVRLGGFAAGVFQGTRLVASKVGSRQVHGRSAAGGWSQQRFARRREGQVRVALTAATDAAAAVLLPEADRLDAVVLGGDRRSLATVLEDRRLAPLRPLVVEPVLAVPDPRLKVLQATPAQFRAVRILVSDVSTRPTSE